MKILFRNSYIKNREWAKDMFRYISFRQPKIIVMDVYLFLCICLGFFNLIVYKVIDVNLFLIVIIVKILQVFLYITNVNITLKRNLEMHGKPIEVTFTVADEYITMLQSTGSESYLNYVDIKKAFQTKKYIYLQTKAKLLYPFKKDGFSVGNVEEFLCFLKDKNIKMKK